MFTPGDKVYVTGNSCDKSLIGLSGEVTSVEGMFVYVMIGGKQHDFLPFELERVR